MESSLPALSSESVSEERQRWLDSERHRLVCRLELSAMYHARRERYLALCERIAQATAALTATAAFARVVGSGDADRTFALIAAVASVLPLVFLWSSRSNKHATLAAEHRRLHAVVMADGFDLSEEKLVQYRSQLLTTEANERASLGALVVHCQNEMAIAAGHPANIVPLKWYQRALMHAWDFTVDPPKQKAPPLRA